MYKGRKYSHGEEVATSQVCLNCTCQHGFVSCFLRVCPVLRPPDNDDTCYLLKEPATCCAVLKCSGSATSRPPSAYHFNPGKPQLLNSLERKAPEVYRRPTARPPYKDYWTSVRPTSRQQQPGTSSRPLMRATPRPSFLSRGGSSTSTRRPANRPPGFPASPTFSQRRPNYPLSVPSKPTPRRSLYTSTSTTRRPTVTHASAHVNPLLQSPPLKEEDGVKESGSFFRMSSILV